jgi:hypothetical protein
MTIPEFSDQFDVLYNNITSNQAPGLNEYEKSLFLTKAEKEIVKNYFTANSKGNNIGQGFDDSAKRQADFSILMKTSSCTPFSGGSSTTITRKKYVCTSEDGTQTQTLYDDAISVSVIGGSQVEFPEGTYSVETVEGVTITSFPADNPEYEARIDNYPYASGTMVYSIETITVSSDCIDDRSQVYDFPDDVFIVINEAVKIGGLRKQVIPLRYDEYTRLMSKPFKRPVKNQVWRLINTGRISSNKAVKTVEIIAGPGEVVSSYKIRYIRVPEPIIVGDLDELTIDGKSTISSECEVDPILHEDILQRAVELAKAAWTATGQDNTNVMLQTGQRSE